MIALCAKRLFTPKDEIQDGLVLIEDGKISEVARRSEREIPRDAKVFDFARDFPDCALAPGYLDVHVHGSVGIDLMRSSDSDLPRFQQFLATRGVTGYFATTVAAPMDQTCRALEQMADAIDAAQDGGGRGAIPLGIHLEGPFLSHQRRGVHAPEYLLTPTVESFDKLWQAACGHVKMITIAPELPGAIEVIAEAARRGVCVSIGHSDATLEQARAGVRAGARHATHTFNAMRPLDHRAPGILGEVLENPRLTADIIADGIHVAAEVLKLFLQAKGIERAVLITDATAAAGMPDGRYRLGPIEVEVKNGTCTADGKLAGSVLTMDAAVRNVSNSGGWSLRDAVRAATLNAAQAVGLKMHGELKPGGEANFVLLSPLGEVRRTMVHGTLAGPDS